MEEDTEYKKLPVDERCVHKLWKARVDGYEELIKIFRGIDDEKAPEWNKYVGLVKKFVVDSHAMAQERGLEATLIFVENAGNAGKTVSDVVSGLVTKCFSAPKAKVKDLAFQITLMYIEIEKQDATIDELVKGLDAKNPKIVAATISILTQALREFGNKVVGIKPFIKKIPVLLADRDKNVRDETKQLTIEIFKWIGPALKPHIASIAAVLLTELEAEFDKVKNEKAEPTRYLKSQQEKQNAIKSGGGGDGDGDGDDGDDDDANQQEEVDPLDLIDPVDILSKLPKDFYEKLEAKKWQERKESLEALQTLLQNPKLETGDYADLVKALKKVLTKDTNVVLVAMAGKCLACLAKGLGKKFSPYAVACVSGILEKFKEKKANVVAALREAIDAIYPSTTLEALQEDITEALNNKNPSIKAETASFLARAFARTQPATLNKKMIKALSTVLLKTLNESDPTVRDTSAEALGTLLKLLGEKAVGPYLVDVDALKMAKIKECSEKAEIFVKAVAPKKERPTTAPVKSSSTATKAGSAEPKAVTRPASGAVAKKPGTATKKIGASKLAAKAEPPCEREMSPDEEVADEISTSRVDISPQITEALIAEISDKNWKTRIEGLTKLQAILNDAKSIKPNIGDLPQALSHRLVDSNAKIAQTSMAICQQLAEAMGPSCKQHVRVLFPGFLNGLGDNKAVMRAASIQCMNAWGDQCGYKEFFDGEMVAEALKSGSPALRIELWAWLSEKLPTMPPKSIPKDEILACLPYLYANILDRNADVRKNANEAVLGCMLHVGYEPMFKALEHQKPASKKTILAALDKARPSLPVKPLPKGKLSAPVEESKPTKVVAGKGQKTVTPANKPSSSRKKEEDVDTSPLLPINNLKNQRMLDEQKLKVLKWTFTTPREEFTELLRDQMTTAGLNKNLMANMFHEDFRYHLKVIEALLDDLNDNQKALICNLDLILKWISLRFYDTNPSVLLKGLDYLNVVMQMLIATEYDMSETEGTSFLPHLLIKLGDPKDAVRNGVRSLFRQICLTYPFTKVFACIMDGLKSKNARQRTECLDELGYLIETYGMGACQPSAQIALKEIAKHIADRDNSVRSAALNCVVQAYFLVEDKVYKLIGQLSEKDLSMLDERIKRAKKTRKVPSEMPMKPVAAVKPDMDDDEMIEEDEHEDEANETPPAVIVPEVQPEVVRPKPSGPFKLDQDFINEIEKDWVRSELWQIPKPLDVDTGFLYSPLKSAEVNGVSYPADRLQRLISAASQHMLTSPVSHGMNYAANTTISMNTLNASPSSAASQNLPDILPKLDPNLMRILRSVGSTDTITARAGLNELNDILESPEKQAALRDYEEIYIENVCLQLKNLSQIPVSDALAIYQPLLSSIYSFYTSQTLGKNVGIEPLKKFMALIIGLMVEQKLPNSEENEYTKVVNGICLKIFDKSNFTNIICALIRLLKETCSGAGLPKFTDLLMKCIWRNVKNLPEKSNEIDYDVVLLEVHEFMVQLPSSYWHQRHADTPYRTVKTIIHHLAQIKGNNILQHLTKIPQHSELYSYLLKVLKNIQKDNQNSGSRPQSTPSKRNTVQSHEAVSAIFKLISDKETKQEGIQKLYEFKTKNPDVDIDHYLHGSNPIFRKFIDDGLAELERAAAENNPSDNKVLTENRFGAPKTSGKDADYWMERLNALKKNTQDNDQSTDNRASFDNLNVNLLAQKTFITTKETTENLSTNRLELMKQRLAQVRSQK